jgi:hypothetical protein
MTGQLKTNYLAVHNIVIKHTGLIVVKHNFDPQTEVTWKIQLKIVSVTKSKETCQQFSPSLSSVQK